MQANYAFAAGKYCDSDEARREDWLANSSINGFAATFAMTVSILAAYWAAKGLGESDGGRIERWFHALHDNSLTRSTEDSVILAVGLNLMVGLGWALLYGYSGAQRLSGPSWLRGAIFALVPWLLSIFVFFPVMDAGILGRDLGAGPLPVLGNLVLHLIYGAVLGALYAIDLESWLDGSEVDYLANRGAETGAAVGMVVGAPIGLLVAWVVAPTIEEAVGKPIVALLGTLIGAALGLTFGSFAGIERGVQRWNERSPHR